MRDDLLRIAVEAEAANGLLAGEVTAKLLREAFKVIWPMPLPMRVPRRADGQPWGGDGLGPYTPEYVDWTARSASFGGLIAAGAHLEVAMRLVPTGSAVLIEFDGKMYFASVGDIDVCQVGGGYALAIIAAACRARAGQ